MEVDEDEESWTMMKSERKRQQKDNNDKQELSWKKTDWKQVLIWSSVEQSARWIREDCLQKNK